MGNSELILIVEDEAALRTLAALMLEKLGYRTIQAANGEEAISMVEGEVLRPQLILTDVVMPGMSGRALIDRLRQSHPKVRVIFMSGYTDDSVADHGVIDADTAFLQKPFSMGDLAALVRSTLSIDTAHNDDMRTT